jgi:uncharacterized membrane protein YdjX (TVP38/TMEM64 family)
MTMHKTAGGLQLIPPFRQKRDPITRPVQIALALIVLGLGAVALYQSGFLTAGQGLIGWLESWRDSVWAVPIILTGFVALTFVAVPQFVLIGMCVAVFGPVSGFFIAWVATMISAWIGFTGGPFLSRGLFPKMRSRTLARVSNFVARNGFWSAFIVRFLPSGPFVLVNMALGASRVKLFPFLIGTSIGVLPKGILIALTGAGLMTAANAQGQTTMVILCVAALIWGVMAVFSERMVFRLIKQGEITSPSLEIKCVASQKG